MARKPGITHAYFEAGRAVTAYVFEHELEEVVSHGGEMYAFSDRAWARKARKAWRACVAAAGGRRAAIDGLSLVCGAAAADWDRTYDRETFVARRLGGANDSLVYRIKTKEKDIPFALPRWLSRLADDLKRKQIQDLKREAWPVGKGTKYFEGKLDEYLKWGRLRRYYDHPVEGISALGGWVLATAWERITAVVHYLRTGGRLEGQKLDDEFFAYAQSVAAIRNVPKEQ